MLDRIRRLALQTLDRLDSTGYAARLLGRARKGQPAAVAGDYDLARLQQRVAAPLQPSAAFSWSLQDIVRARDAQMAGDFHLAADMSASMNTDDPIYVARQTRLAPLGAFGIRLDAAGDGGKAGRVAGHAAPLFGEGGPVVSRGTEKAINRDLADHGVAFGINQWELCDGYPVPTHQHWPIRDVCWDESVERFLAIIRVDADEPATKAPATLRRLGRYISSVPIVHGDGRWTVYQSQAHHPWQHDAAILPGSIVWARHAFPGADWCNVSRSHGSPKWVGTLPENSNIQKEDQDGNLVLTAEAKGLLDLMADLAGLPMPYGIKAYGSEAELIVNQSTAWQIFKELMDNSERAAARIWTGSDALLGARGGAPGVDISELFGVTSTIIQRDATVIDQAFREGVVVPWTALRFGSAALAPRRVHVLPDPDAQRAREELAANEAAFVAAVGARRAANLLVTQEWVDELAERLGVARAELAAPRASGFQLAPTDLARVLDANEARSSVGLGPKDGGDVPLLTYGEAPAPASGVVPIGEAI